MNIKSFIKSVLKNINPTYRKTCHIEELLMEGRPYDNVVIDKCMNTVRYYCYDYENIASTIIRGKKSVLFIDIGANKGQSARLAYKFFGKGGAIFR